NDLKNAMATQDAYDAIYGSPAVQLESQTRTETWVEVVVNKKYVGNETDIGATWLAVTGVFRGLSAGGWDMFSNFMKTVWVNGTTAPPYMITVYRNATSIP
ncbi:MAG: hypothetical protein ACP5I3_11985, partial [Thermoproteus sp.]